MRASSGSLPLRDADGVVSRLAEAWKALKVNGDPVTEAAVQALEAGTPQSKQAFHCDRGIHRGARRRSEER